MIGGSGPGDRADLGVINEYAARAFLNEAPADWANARLFTLGTVNYPFATRLYPDSFDAVEHVKPWGKPVVLSDGDVVFQPLKVERSGIFEEFNGNVLIYIHKEQELDDVERRFPADHYVLIDDKLRILSAVKKIWGAKVTTVFPKQGHYAHDPEVLAAYPPADISIERIGDLLNVGRERFMPQGS